MKIKKITAVFFLVYISVFLFMSCPSVSLGITSEDLVDLPDDSGGEHTPYVLGSSTSPYGFYCYVPGGYDATEQTYPLLVFLHGAGEKGNSDVNPDDLNRILVNGPPKLIQQENWEPPYPMIVVSFQCPTGTYWNPAKIHEAIEYIISRYRINLSRIYVTGLSMGGYGTFNYIGQYGDDSYAAAAVPICGAGSTSQAANFRNIPLWAFHGMSDGTVSPSGSIDMVEAINAADPAVQAKLTLYPGVGHDSWSRTYDGTGMGTESEDYDEFSESIYQWMFRYRKE